jgi:hypothetical protein
MLQIGRKINTPCLVMLLVIMAAMSSCRYVISPYVDRELSGAATLNAEWLELNPSNPLKPDRDTQDVTLFPDPPIIMVENPNGQRDVKALDGRDAEIEAELIGSNGITYRSSPVLVEEMTRDLKVMSRTLHFPDLPKDITYVKLRIKSSVGYPVKKILWRCYNRSDVYD